MSNPVVVTHVEQPDQAAVAALEKYGVSTVHEAQGRNGLLASYMRPIYAGAAIAGQRGDGFIAAGRQFDDPRGRRNVHARQHSRGGSHIALHRRLFWRAARTSLRAHGAKGLVIEAGVRDVGSAYSDEVSGLEPRGHSQGTVKATLGSVNVPIVCAGAAIDPGDVIVADDDGVVVVKRADAAKVAAASKQRMDKEDVVRERSRQRRAWPGYLQPAREAERDGARISLSNKDGRLRR